MLKNLFLTVLLACPMAIPQESEEAKTRPNKQEAIDAMVKTGRMPATQQRNKIDSILKDPSGSKTPRSDFLFCLGLGYMGNYMAQKCVGNAYEKGIGIVEDLSEAYAWYSAALENRIADDAAKQSIESDRDRVRNRLLSAYPHPTEDDLDDMAKALQTQIKQYQEDVKKSSK